MNPQVDSDGNRHWYRDGRRYRDGGPAIEYADGSKVWFRDGGPAIEYADGSKEWYRDGGLHRDGGPAIEMG